jgi:hypothetical protein
MAFPGTDRGVARAQVILGLALAGVLGTVGLGWRATGAEYAARDAARTQLLADSQAILEWREQHPRQTCPPSLTAVLGATARTPRDPWGEPLVYRCPGTAGAGFELLSKGPDRVLGTGDDLQEEE